MKEAEPKPDANQALPHETNRTCQFRLDWRHRCIPCGKLNGQSSVVRQ